MKRLLLSVISAFALAQPVLAADVPSPGSGDKRVRYITYDKDQVASIHVRVGSVARIILGDDERIEVSATGMTADCQNPDSLWCIHADVGAHEIWVKPKPGAKANNLELRTNARDYSIEFKVEGPSKTPPSAMYRVMYRYPVDLSNLSASMAQAQANSEVSEAERLSDRLSAKLIPKNWKYTQKARRGSNDIKPSLVFDDGRFTYFRFAANREVPTIFYIDPAGDEARINYHMEGDLAVVERTGRRFVLRLGASVVGIWNENYSVDGVGSPAGVTVAGIERKVVP